MKAFLLWAHEVEVDVRHSIRQFMVLVVLMVEIVGVACAAGSFYWRRQRKPTVTVIVGPWHWKLPSCFCSRPLMRLHLRSRLSHPWRGLSVRLEVSPVWESNSLAELQQEWLSDSTLDRDDLSDILNDASGNCKKCSCNLTRSAWRKKLCLKPPRIMALILQLPCQRMTAWNRCWKNIRCPRCRKTSASDG